MQHRQENRKGTGKVTAAFLVLVLAASVAMTGCSTFEQNTYKALATSRAVILEAKQQAESGNIQKTQANVTLINNAQRVHNDAVVAFRAYIEAEVAFNSAKANEAAASALNKSQLTNETYSAQITLQQKLDAANHALVDVASVVRDVRSLIAKKK